LAGVPYAVKNLCDIEGMATLAGSRINAELAPAHQDATAVRRAGCFPMSSSLDTIGAFARTAVDLAACYDAVLGADPRAPAAGSRASEPVSRATGCSTCCAWLGPN
jgi:Asp-tRNA(Asn)/Glu-tRNA(Gln) amidotransferase A subunit family amidase